MYLFIYLFSFLTILKYLFSTTNVTWNSENQQKKIDLTLIEFNFNREFQRGNWATVIIDVCPTTCSPFLLARLLRSNCTACKYRFIPPFRRIENTFLQDSNDYLAINFCFQTRAQSWRGERSETPENREGVSLSKRH